MPTKTKFRTTKQLIREIHKPMEKPLNDREKRQVKRLAGYGTERKYIITTQPAIGVDFSATGILLDLVQVPQGTSDSTRVGDRIEMKNIEIRYTFAIGSSTNNIVRFIIFQWRSSSIPNTNAVLQNIGTSNAPLTFHTHDYLPMMTVLYDRVHTINNLAMPVVTSRALVYKGFNKIVEYVAGGVTTGKNHVYAIAISDDGAAPYPQLAYECKFTFVDK